MKIFRHSAQAGIQFGFRMDPACAGARENDVVCHSANGFSQQMTIRYVVNWSPHFELHDGKHN